MKNALSKLDVSGRVLFADATTGPLISFYLEKGRDTKATEQHMRLQRVSLFVCDHALIALLQATTMEVHTLDSPPPTYIGSAVSPLTDFWECREMRQPAGRQLGKVWLPGARVPVAL